MTSAVAVNTNNKLQRASHACPTLTYIWFHTHLDKLTLNTFASFRLLCPGCFAPLFLFSYCVALFIHQSCDCKPTRCGTEDFLFADPLFVWGDCCSHLLLSCNAFSPPTSKQKDCTNQTNVDLMQSTMIALISGVRLSDKEPSNVIRRDSKSASNEVAATTISSMTSLRYRQT
jgi:hypothetical protein